VVAHDLGAGLPHRRRRRHRRIVGSDLARRGELPAIGRGHEIQHARPPVVQPDCHRVGGEERGGALAKQAEARVQVKGRRDGARDVGHQDRDVALQVGFALETGTVERHRNEVSDGGQFGLCLSGFRGVVDADDEEPERFVAAQKGDQDGAGTVEAPQQARQVVDGSRATVFPDASGGGASGIISQPRVAVEVDAGCGDGLKRPGAGIQPQQHARLPA
jgi:hypothetical protein